VSGWVRLRLEAEEGVGFVVALLTPMQIIILILEQCAPLLLNLSL
jgi:hypothetical protein